MQNEKHNQKTKLKFYHFILFGCLFGCLLIINSNHVNNKKMKIKLNKEKGELFDKIISKRHLQQLTPVVETNDEEIEVYATDDICSRASPELIKYYNSSGSLKDLGINEQGGIKCEDKDKPYMKALIDILKNLLGESGDEEEDDEEDYDRNPQDNYDPNGENAGADDPNGRLRYRRQLRRALSLDSDMKTNLITYLKRVLPMVIALAMSVLGIIGWIVCCFCNCCNCCCCCCCKKQKCKIPCFIWTFILYGGVVAVCIYGLTQTKKIFVGLSNTECSILRFFDELLFGEMKQTLPRWAGIEGINTILQDLSDVISSMGPSTYQALENGLDEIEEEQETFDDMLKEVGDKFYDDGNYFDGEYSKDYTGERYYLDNGEINGRCVLDIIYSMGRYVEDQVDPTTGKYEPEESILGGWNREYSAIAEEANYQMQEAQKGFSDILDRNLDKISDTLHDAKGKFDDLQSPINDIYDSFSQSLYDYSVLIDDYGKDGVTLVFGALAIINIALAVLMLLICLCSGKMCVNCCCCRCICKLFTHLLWNILALLMIITLLVGAIIGLIGRIGGDMMSVLSFVMSQENFEDENPVIINQMGDALQYLNCCINGDGDIAALLNISDSINSFDQIHSSQGTIERAITNFSQILNCHLAYNYAEEYYEKRINYIDQPLSPITAINLLDQRKSLGLTILNGLLNDNINDYDRSKKESWALDGDKEETCETTTSPVKFHPSICKPSDRAWIQSLNPSNGGAEKDVKNYADLITDIVEMIENMKNKNQGGFKDTIDNLLVSYQNYLRSYINVLKDFNETINSITSILDEYTGRDSGQSFAFLNGLFIGKNLKIILKYLKYTFGEDLYTVGLCLIIVGFSLIFSISSTILTIVIINVDIDINKEFMKQEEIAEFETEQEDLQMRRRMSSSRRKSKSRRKNNKY